jgi:Carboxypeptidase regulatory-like domain/TonB-dependent Receptor Plug Domain
MAATVAFREFPARICLGQRGVTVAFLFDRGDMAYIPPARARFGCRLCRERAACLALPGGSRMHFIRLLRRARIAAAMAMLVFASTFAYAQGGAISTLSGTVTDTSGAVLPGADVKIKNNATGAQSNTVTAENGTFSVPALNAGTYTVTMSLMGFKTAVLNDVVLNAGVPASVRPKLEIGGLEETVVVQSGGELVQTQTSQVSNTLNTTMLTNLPLISRAALNAVAGLSGVNTPGDVRDSTINGLPQSTINITLDGMNIQDNWLKTTDGFFARLNPSLDAVEEVTVTTAANGADSGGQGAANIRMVTRSGSNQLRGSGYYYLRHDALNANTWFNNRDLAPDPKTGKAPKTALRQYQPGIRVGGPITFPGLWSGRDKAFFFVNYEETRSPRNVTYTRNLMHPLAQQGIFRYTASGGVQSVDLLSLADKNGHLATIDPTVAKLLADIRSSTVAGTGGGSLRSQLAAADVPEPGEWLYAFPDGAR